jgi:hypothetical protein
MEIPPQRETSERGCPLERGTRKFHWGKMLLPGLPKDTRGSGITLFHRKLMAS